MRSGRLRHLLVIQSLAGGSPRQSSSGERQDQWTELARVRADIRPLSGREFRAADQAQSAIGVEIEIRYLAGVAGGMRAYKLGEPGVMYQIHAALDPDLRHKRLLLQCSSGVVNAEVAA
jgi:SPP1 family predicted phage head-tail adaptor